MNNSWIERKKTNPIFVGSVGVGGDHPISIQSMTNTNTADIQATVSQIEELQAAGADIVRVSVPDKDCANAFKSIKDLVSMIGDIMDVKITIKSDKNRIRPKDGEVDRLRANINKAKKILKWEPNYKGKIGLKNGLEKTIEWFKDDENNKQYKTNIYNV